MLALNFVFSKTKMFKLLFILFVINQITGQSNIGYRYLFSQDKHCPTRESWVVIIQIETLHKLSVLIFACIYFCELKKIIFPEYLFYANGKFWKFRVYKFQPHRIKDKKKTVESEDMRQISVKINGKTGRPWWKNCCYLF